MVLIARIALPEHAIMYRSGNIRLKLGNEIIGTGTIYLTQEVLAWQPADYEEGVSMLWKEVSVHGISTNPSKCIYFMLDHIVDWPGVYEANGTTGNFNGLNGVPGAAGAGGEPMEEQQPVAVRNNDIDEGNETDEDDGDDAGEAAGGAIGDYAEANEMTECWLLPAQSELHTVDTIFRIMTECQAMHPDSSDSISDEGSDYMDDDGGPAAILNNYRQGGVGVGVVRNRHAEAAAQGGMQNLSLDDIDDERFEDAEEE